MPAVFNAPTAMVVLRASVSNTNPGAFAEFTATRALRVIDVVGNKNQNAGGAGDTLLVGNGAAAITNAMVLNVAANISFRAASVDTATARVASGGSVRVTVAFNTNNGCVANIYCVPA